MKVDNQLVPITSVTASLPDHMGSQAVYELVYQASVPPLGFSLYFVKAATVDFVDVPIQKTQSQSDENNEVDESQAMEASDIVIKNEYLMATFSGTTGLLKSLSNLGSSITLDISQTLMYYKGFAGDNHDGDHQASGAYVFRPNGTDPLPISTTVMTTVVQGSEVQEVHQMFSDWSSQVYRLYKGSKHLEVEWTVGHIPIDDKIGKEIISRYTTSLNTQKTFYTDANGREIIKRVRDYRPTWNLTQTEPVAGNYFPINSRIYIQDVAKNVQLTVFTDRSHGGGSIMDGQMEILIHRRLMMDDAFGVGEPLNEPGLDNKGLYARGKHYLYLDTIEKSVAQRDMAQRLYMAPTVAFIGTTMDALQFSQHYRTNWSGLKRPLPDNVHLLTLEQWHSGYFLLRLEHFYAKSEDKVLSQPARVQLKDLFVPFTIESLDEVTLGANQFLSNATRLQWTVAGQGRTQRDMKSFVTPIDPATMTVELKPMQIRTFLVILKETTD